MREFWVSSGHHLTQRADHGGLIATPELIMAYLARPELAPPEEACGAERALHAALLLDPMRAVNLNCTSRPLPMRPSAPSMPLLQETRCMSPLVSGVRWSSPA